VLGAGTSRESRKRGEVSYYEKGLGSEGPLPLVNEAGNEKISGALEAEIEENSFWKNEVENF